MNTDRNTARTSGTGTLSVVVTIALLAAAFIAAFFTQNSVDLFQRIPDVTGGATGSESVPELDKIPLSKVYAFHATIYTIWATIVLCVPAFCTVWFVRGSARARRYWLPFWTAGLVAMVVHQYMAMGVLFEWNWQHILEDTVRVTIPKPDIVLTVWWCIDVLLGWCLWANRSLFIHSQRILLHVALLIIFLIGFIREGESVVSNGIGYVSGAVVCIAVIIGLSKVVSNRSV